MRLTEQVEALQNLLVAAATGSTGDNADYADLRQALLARSRLRP